jgi:hypothetical protein
MGAGDESAGCAEPENRDIAEIAVAVGGGGEDEGVVAPEALAGGKVTDLQFDAAQPG